MQTPKSKAAYRRWLRQQFDILEALDSIEPDFYDMLDIAALVGQACRYACRFGGGDMIGTEQPTVTPLQALAVLGRLLAWAEQSNPPDLLSVRDVAAKLGASSRSVWRMLSAGEIPQPIKIRGKTKWRAVEIEAMIELSPSTMR